MKVGIYCRVSTDMQRDKNESIPDQKRIGKEFAESMGWEYQFYTDSQTGKNPKREGFVKLREDVFNGKIQAIWIKNHYRLARRASTALSLIEDLEDMYRAGNYIPLYLLNRLYDYDNPNDKMIFTIWAGLAESEGSQIVERTKRGRDNKFLGGGMHVRRLYGYYRSYNNVSGKAEYHIHEKESEIVKEIIEKVIQGKSYREIALSLTSRGIPTPEGNKKWRPTTVARIADQKLYAGYYDYQDKVNIKSYLYEPIIDWQTHLLAVDATNRAIERKRGTDEGKTRHNHHMLTTIFKCWHCEGSIYYSHDKRFGYEYYKLLHVGKECPRTVKHQTMNVIDAEYWVIFSTLEFLLDKDTMWKLYEKQRKEVAEKSETYNEEIESFNKEIKKIKGKKTKLLSLDLDDEDVIDEIRDLSARQKEIEIQKKNIVLTLAKQDNELDYILTELMKDSTDEFLEATQFKKRKMLMNWIKHGWVKDDTLIIEWITGRVDELPQYRKVFKSDDWKNIRETVTKYPLMKIYRIYENMKEEKEGSKPNFSKMIQGLVDKGLLKK